MVGWHSYISTGAADACSALISLHNVTYTITAILYLTSRQRSRVYFWIRFSMSLWESLEEPDKSSLL